jgi:hypothetical protein
MIRSLVVAPLLIATLIDSTVTAFSVLPTKNCNHHAAPVVVLKSEPSDTSGDAFYQDDIVTIESEPFQPSGAESMVTNLMDLIPITLGEVSKEQRASINEVLLKLEALNPTAQPAVSPLVNGVWELRYAAGYTAEGTLPSPTR